MAEPTDRQLEILRYIARTAEERGFPPTLREIGQAFRIRSTNGVNDHLRALEKKGFLNRGTQKSRTLCPTSKGRLLLGMPAPGAARALAVPLLGRVAAGAPLLAVENVEDSFQVDAQFLPARQGLFALKVKGDSMVGDGIFDGDIVFVRSQPTAQAGEVVVALIDGEATVKRFYPEGDRVRLQPSNPAYSPLYLDAGGGCEPSVLGVVVAVFRVLRPGN